MSENKDKFTDGKALTIRMIAVYFFSVLPVVAFEENVVPRQLWPFACRLFPHHTSCLCCCLHKKSINVCSVVYLSSLFLRENARTSNTRKSWVMISQNSSLTCHLLADCLNKMMYYVRSVTDCADNVIIYVHIMSL